jgi:hypothetical protein
VEYDDVSLPYWQSRVFVFVFLFFLPCLYYILPDRDVLIRLPAKINLKIKKYYFNIFLNKNYFKNNCFFCRVLKTKSKVKCFYIG